MYTSTGQRTSSAHVYVLRMRAMAKRLGPREHYFMRMWNVPTELLCDQHLLGEHVEHHMFIGSILRGTSLAGYVERGLVEVHNLPSRHDALAEELARRGMNHRSPLPAAPLWVEGSVDVEESLRELHERCPNCRDRINLIYLKEG